MTIAAAITIILLWLFAGWEIYKMFTQGYPEDDKES